MRPGTPFEIPLVMELRGILADLTLREVMITLPPCPGSVFSATVLGFLVFPRVTNMRRALAAHLPSWTLYFACVGSCGTSVADPDPDPPDQNVFGPPDPSPDPDLDPSIILPK